MKDLIERVEAATEGSRFLAKVRIADGCWFWTASTRGSRQKRGCFWNGEKNVDAARWVLSLTCRQPAENECACHHCDNPPCVRPDHLYWGTHQRNMDDMHARKRGWHDKDPSVGQLAASRRLEAFRKDPSLQVRGSQHGQAKLNEPQVAQIKQYLALGHAKRALARQYGVHCRTILKIAQGKLWKHV